MKALIDIVALTVLRVLICPLEHLPRRIAEQIAYGYVRVMISIIPRFKMVAERNLAIAFPDLPAEQRSAIFERSLRVMSGSLVQLAKIPQLTSERAKELLDYEQEMQRFEEIRSRNPGKGLLLVCLHFGHPEFFIQLHALRYRPAYILARGFGLPRVDTWVNARRERFGHKIFSRKGGYQELTKRLNEGHDVMILFDQNVKRNHAVFTEFFGLQAATTKTVALAAIRTGCEVILGTAREEEDGRYTLLMNPVEPPSALPGTSEEQIQACTAELNKLAEAHIRRYPEGWMWFHRRWKTRPEGEPETVYS